MLADGLDRSCPAGHSDLPRPIGDVILLESELPSGSPPVRHRFIAQNRLMTALSDATSVSEAGVHAGTMITMLTARVLGRGIGAVPGPVTSAASTGSNELIKQRFASLITEPGEVIALLDAEAASERIAALPAPG